LLVALVSFAVVLLAGASVWWFVRQRTTAPGSARRATVAVLPFQNAGGGADTDFLRLSLPDEIATTLSYTPALSLRPFASTRRFASGDFDPQVAGKELHVQEVITGHFAPEPGGLRVTLEVIDVDDDRLAWRESVTAPAQDWIALRERVNAAVRTRLLPALGLADAGQQAPRPNSAEGYSLYLRAIALPRDVAPNLQAIAMLERTVQLDPNFAPAWSELGNRYYYDGEYGTGGPQRKQQSDAAARRALAADPNLVDAAERLVTNRTERGDLDGAYDEARRLLQKRPDRARSHFAVSYVLRYAGLLEEAARECDTAMALDSTDYGLRSCALNYIWLGRYDRAEDFVRLDAGSEWSRDVTADILFYRGQKAEALKILQQLPPDRALDDGTRRAYLEHRPASELQAIIQRLEGELKNVPDSEPKYWTAFYMATAGYPQPALRLIQRAVEQNYCAYPMMESDPFLADVRKLPGYPAVRDAGKTCQQRFLAHRGKQSP
jgi:TolB-like protein